MFVSDYQLPYAVGNSDQGDRSVEEIGSGKQSEGETGLQGIGVVGTDAASR